MRERREQIVAPRRSQPKWRETAPRLVRVRRSDPPPGRAGLSRQSICGRRSGQRRPAMRQCEKLQRVAPRVLGAPPNRLRARQ